MAGDKFDKGKLRMDLVPKEAIDGLAEVLGYGASKYGDHNWRGGIDHSRYYSACIRHLTAYWNGETVDPESGINHLKHAMCNIAFMLATPGRDDRYMAFEATTIEYFLDETDDDSIAVIREI